MDSSKKTEDDTIRDEMEQGYVATRPRFTRVRRTWACNVRNLLAEDVRALDQFFMVKASRGGNAFLYPNLLANGSFELPAQNPSDVVLGWNIAQQPAQLSVGVAPIATDGSQCIKCASVSGQSVPAHTTETAQLSCDQPVPCTAGDAYVVTAQVNGTKGTLASGVLSAAIVVSFVDANGNALSALSSAITVASIAPVSGYQFAIPTNAVAFTIMLAVSLANSTGSGISLDGSTWVTWDAAGCALQTPLTPYGRMLGSQPLGCLVRFSRAPEVSDIGWVNGAKGYGASLELTEV